MVRFEKLARCVTPLNYKILGLMYPNKELKIPLA